MLNPLIRRRGIVSLARCPAGRGRPGRSGSSTWARWRSATSAGTMWSCCSRPPTVLRSDLPRAGARRGARGAGAGRARAGDHRRRSRPSRARRAAQRAARPDPHDPQHGYRRRPPLDPERRSWSRARRWVSRRKSSRASGSRWAGLRRPDRGQRRRISLDDVDHADVINPILRERGQVHARRSARSSAAHHRRAPRRDVDAADVHARRVGALELVAERLAVAIETCARPRRDDRPRRAEAELRRRRVARAAHPDDRGLRDPDDAARAARRARRGVRRQLGRRPRSRPTGSAPDRAAARPVAARRALVTIDPEPLVLRQVLEDVAEASAPGTVGSTSIPASR